MIYDLPELKSLEIMFRIVPEENGLCVACGFHGKVKIIGEEPYCSLGCYIKKNMTLKCAWCNENIVYDFEELEWVHVNGKKDHIAFPYIKGENTYARVKETLYYVDDDIKYIAGRLCKKEEIDRQITVSLREGEVGVYLTDGTFYNERGEWGLDKTLVEVKERR